MVAPIRRVITGHDANGKAVIIFDSDAPNSSTRENGSGSTQLGRTSETPADHSGSEDPVVGQIPLIPPKGGSMFRVVEFAPETEADQAESPGTLARSLGAHVPESAVLRHQGSHRTDSIDYAIVMSGEIDMWLDDERDDVHLKAGDIVVQRGTNHAWVNRGTEPCQIAFVLIDAKPAI